VFWWRPVRHGRGRRMPTAVPGLAHFDFFEDPRVQHLSGTDSRHRRPFQPGRYWWRVGHASDWEWRQSGYRSICGPTNNGNPPPGPEHVHRHFGPLPLLRRVPVSPHRIRRPRAHRGALGVVANDVGPYHAPPLPRFEWDPGAPPRLLSRHGS